MINNLNYQKQIDEENKNKNIITNEFTEKGKLDLILNIDEGIEKIVGIGLITDQPKEEYTLCLSILTGGIT